MWRCSRPRSCPNPQWQHIRRLRLLRSYSAGRSKARRTYETPHEAPNPALPYIEAITHRSEPEKYHDGPPSPSRKHSLPLSPLMSPSLVAARNRHRTPKPAAAPAAERSAFSQKLRNNPYALALASPIRNCTLTGLRLPEFFHLGFGLQTNPQTGELWFLPRMAADTSPKLTRKEGEGPDSCDDTSDFMVEQRVPSEQQIPEDTSNRPDEQRAPSEHKTFNDTTDPTDKQQSPTSPTTPHLQPSTNPSSSPEPPKFRPRTLSSTHLPLRHSALHFISTFTPRQQRALIPFRWKEDPSLSFSASPFHYRHDMAAYVLSLLRQRVYDGLKELGGRKAGYIARCDSWDTVGKSNQAGAVLWLGEGRRVVKIKPDANGGESEGEEEDVVLKEMGIENCEWSGVGGDKIGRQGQGPPVYAMAYYREKYIPAYNLPFLLGSEMVDKLSSKVGNMKGEMAILKSKHCTIGCQMALWRLMGYLAPWEGDRTG